MYMRETKSAYLDFVEASFAQYFREKGYIEEAPVEITSEIDKTVDYVGSYISPLKKYVLTEDFGENGRFLIQNCMKLKALRYLKTDVPQRFGTYFKCMGVLSKPDLERSVYETFDYFTSEEYLNIPLDNLCIKICSKDQDLLSAIKNVDSRINREIDKTSIEHYRHKYGMEEEQITGRDFNIGLKVEGTEQYISCASFVLMESPDRKIAIDMGIGNCTLSMCKFGTNSTVSSSRMADIINITSLEEEKFADALIAVSTLLKEDITHHRSKHYRRRFREFLHALFYWNDKLHYTNAEILDFIMRYLNTEYKEDFTSNKETFLKILLS